MSFIAEWVWDSAELSAAHCLHTLPTMTPPCWKQLMAKLLGSSIIVGACLSKLPIVRNLLQSKSSAGFPRSAVLCEVLVTANATIYGMKHHFPFTAYGENVALMLQSIVIVVLTYKFSEQSIPWTEYVGIAVASGLYLVATLWLLPLDYQYLIMASNLPIACIARGSMILEAIRLKHTGTQSIVTNGLNLIGSAVRILTTIQEVGWDLPVLTGFTLGVVLNVVLVAQCWYYQANTKKFLRRLETKKAE